MNLRWTGKTWNQESSDQNRRGEFNNSARGRSYQLHIFLSEVNLWHTESIAEVFPKFELLTLQLDPAPAQPPSVCSRPAAKQDSCACRWDSLTSDLHKTHFLTQRADSFKGTLLPPLHRTNLPQKDISVWDSCGFRPWLGLSSRGRDCAWQLCKCSKELEGKYEKKMNLFGTKHVYFNFSAASEKSLSKTLGYKSKWERERKTASERKSLLWLAMKDYSGSITVFT